MARRTKLREGVDAERIEQWPVARLVPYAMNARLHSDEQVDQLAESIKRFGFNVPVLVDDEGSIVAGHGRVMAALKLKRETIPTIRLKHLTADQVKAYRLADNRIALNSSWDIGALAVELGELKDLGFDPGTLGFDANDLSSIFPTAPDEFPAVGADVDTEHECPKCHYRWSGKTS